MNSIIRNEYGRLKSNHGFSHEWICSHYISTEAPILIGGAGRSGTTLMSVMLNSHPDIYCGPEYGLLARGGFSLPGIAANLDLALKPLEEVAKNSQNRWQFLEKAIRCAKQHHAVSFFATKNPTYIFDLAIIFDVFPNAKFIFMCRDGRDAAVSMRQYQDHIGLRYDVEFDSAGSLSLQYCAENWRTFANAFRLWEKDSRCQIVRYEDLVTQPEKTLRGLCNALQVPYDPRMLAFHQEGVQDRDDVKLAHHTGLMRPLYVDKVQRWRKELSPQQIRIFEAHAGPELEYFGYSRFTE